MRINVCTQSREIKSTCSEVIGDYSWWHHAIIHCFNNNNNNNKPVKNHIKSLKANFHMDKNVRRKKSTILMKIVGFFFMWLTLVFVVWIPKESFNYIHLISSHHLSDFFKTHLSISNHLMVFFSTSNFLLFYLTDWC